MSKHVHNKDCETGNCPEGEKKQGIFSTIFGYFILVMIISAIVRGFDDESTVSEPREPSEYERQRAEEDAAPIWAVEETNINGHKSRPYTSLTWEQCKDMASLMMRLDSDGNRYSCVKMNAYR